VLAPFQLHKALADWNNRPQAPGAALPVSGREETELPDGFTRGRPDSPSVPPAPAPPKAQAGDGVGKIRIPRLDRSIPILEGTGKKELSRGAGHDPASPLPGERGNSILAGHRDTVFRSLDKLQPGDLIEAETAAGRYVYETAAIRIVDEHDEVDLTEEDGEYLTLITCYPFHFVGSAPQRYILTAKLKGN
jgi:sortase A